MVAEERGRALAVERQIDVSALCPSLQFYQTCHCIGDLGARANPRALQAAALHRAATALLPTSRLAMYIVHMKRYSAAQARASLSGLLDAVQAGESVVIERRGVRFRIEAERRSKRRRPRPSSLIERVDPVVMEGEWTWRWGKEGLEFVERRRRR
jgi:antitoxin (DNA-binding transcriptional repressor) of toxin-antitoxin stability system